MKKLFLTTTLIFISLLGFSQDYIIEKNPKVEQVFTTEDIDSLEVKVKILQHQTDTVYYDMTQWVRVVILPKTKKLVGIKEEKTQ